MPDRIVGRPDTWPPELLKDPSPYVPEEPAIDGAYESIVGKPETWPPGTFQANPSQPAPAIRALTPASAVLGDPSFTLRVQGGHFTPGSTIVWNGANEPTTFVSWGEVTTVVNMDTAIHAVSLPVQVRGSNGLLSAPATFTFTEPAPASRRRH